MIISQTPLRISFCGGGSDFEDYYKIHGGAVLTTAINKYVFVIVKERFDDKIVLNYREREIVDEVKDIKHDLIREAMKITGVKNGVEITTLADIPSEGTGLGSSSSITVGLLNALYNFQGVLVTKERLAEQSCHIEIDLLKKPIGRQDQYIASFGGLKFIKFMQYVIKVTNIDIAKGMKNKLNENLLLFYTGITRKADDILVDQSSRMNDNIENLNKLQNFAVQGKYALECGDINEIGKLLHSNWLLKKQLSNKISNPDIDDMYSKALEAGAIGGKLLGAGAGGFMLLYVNNGKRDDVRKSLSDYRELPIGFENDGSKIIFNYRR